MSAGHLSGASKIRIQAVLAADAQYLASITGKPMVRVRLKQDGGNPTDLCFTKTYGEGFAAQHAAANAARHMRKGDTVTVYADEISAVNGHLVLIGVSLVDHPALLYVRQKEAA